MLAFALRSEAGDRAGARGVNALAGLALLGKNLFGVVAADIVVVCLLCSYGINKNFECRL